jgi:hypothetical protein
VDWYGNPLKVDGVIGPKTLWWKGILSLSPLRQEVLKLALGYHAVGAGEDKNNSIQNDGTFVDMLLKPVGLRRLPWCIAFCSHVYQKSGVKLPKYFTSAYQVITWAEQNGKLVDSPLPGDMVAYLHPRQPGDTQIKGQGEINLAIDDQYVYDVVGNITECVRVVKRARTPAMKFIRLIDDQQGELTVPTGMMRIDALADR